MSDPFEPGPVRAGDLNTAIVSIRWANVSDGVVMCARFRKLMDELERGGPGAVLTVTAAPALDHTGFPDTTHMTAARQS